MNLKKKIKLIIDGGQSKVGIESTVIDLTRSPKILPTHLLDMKKTLKILMKKFRI